MNTFYSNAGARIRKLRDNNRYTREYLAERADISPKFLYEIECGNKGFSAETLFKLAKSLSVSCEYILGGKTNNDCNQELSEALKNFSSFQLTDIANILKLINKINSSK